MKKVIVIGHDAVNALGLIQSLGREGLYVVAVIIGKTSSLIKSSKYVKEMYFVNRLQEIPQFLIDNFNAENKIPVFPAGDGVALILDQNFSRLNANFCFEHANGDYTIEQLMDKKLQISIANSHNFNVPKSFFLHKPFDLPASMIYPCIVKPLVSCLGDKRDIHIATSEIELRYILDKQINYSDDIIIQQYINKDYEYDIMGCSFKDGTVYIPLSDRMVKFNRFLQDTSTISYIEPLDEDISKEIVKIDSLMKTVKYNGLFSVEFMHNEVDGQIYFTEINFRNDGENAFIVHSGVNLPFLHYQDLCDLPRKSFTPSSKSRKFIWEGIHFNALIYKQISFWEWLSDLKGVDGFLYYFKEDPKPFFQQFSSKFSKIRDRFKRLLK